MKLYIRRNEKDFGPYPIEQVKQLLQEGRLLKNDQASEDKIAWRELDEILDAKNNEASISEPPPIEDSSKKSQEIVSPKSKPVSELAPEESESIAPKQKKSSRSAANKQPEIKVTEPISNFQENGTTKPKKKLFRVIVYSLIVLIVGFAAFFLGNLEDSSAKDNSVVVNTDYKTEENDKIKELMTQVALLKEKVSENDELRSQLSTLKSQSATDQQKKDQVVVSKSAIGDKTLIITLSGEFKNVFGFNEKLILPFSAGIPDENNYMSPLYNNTVVRILSRTTESQYGSTKFVYKDYLNCQNWKDIKFENMSLLEAWDKFRSSTWGAIFRVYIEPKSPEEFKNKFGDELLIKKHYLGDNLSFSVE